MEDKPVSNPVSDNENSANTLDRRALNPDEEQFVDRRQKEMEKALERRQSSQDRRRESSDRRDNYRFALAGERTSVIVVREERKSVDHEGNVTHSEIIDSDYDVTMLDQSAGGFGFLVDSEVPLQVGHVIRLAESGGMHLVKVCRVQNCEDDQVQHVGGQFIENLVGETENISVLELFVDRRLKTHSPKTTAVIIGTLAVTWSAVIVYTLMSKF